jgi:hypothetical protein
MQEAFCRWAAAFRQKPLQGHAGIDHIVQNRDSLSARISSELSDSMPTRSRICSRRSLIRSSKAWLLSAILGLAFFPLANFLLALGTRIFLPPVYCNRRVKLPARFRFLHFLNQRGHDIEQISHDSIVGDFEDRRLGIFIHCDDRAGTFHADDVLNRAADAESEV